jgi:hypothetical protein
MKPWPLLKNARFNAKYSFARKIVFTPLLQAAGWRPAWINDLRGVWLESGVNRRSPGSPSVEPALARLAEALLLPCRMRPLQIQPLPLD